MKLRNALLASVCTVFAVSAGIRAHAQSAQVSAPPARAGFYGYTPGVAPPARPEPLRHLLYIATPGDNGADGQSGIVVLDHPTPIYGGTVSAPVFSESMRYALRHFDVPPGQ